MAFLKAIAVYSGRYSWLFKILASTVLAGVLNAVRVPLTSVAAVIWFHDPMSGFKILALVITVKTSAS